MLKSFLLISAFVLLPAITPGPFATPAAAAASQDSATPKPSAAMLDKAKKTYGVDCAMCHGDNGNGKTDLAKDMALNMVDWTNPAILSGKPDKQLFDIIRNGKDKMPAEDVGRAGDNEVRALIYYIRSFSKGQTAPADAPPAAPAAPAETAPAAPAPAPASDKPSN
jgi:mono/diheme cytochrome c family protein